MAMIDGEVDDTEMRALIDVLRGFPGIDVTAVGRIGHVVYKHMWQWVEGQGVGLLPTIRHHGDLLAEVMDKPRLESILTRLEDMANADGTMHPMEARLLSALRHKWGLGEA
jgi:uncharacterized tellurite resistance protein B-like protein